MFLDIDKRNDNSIAIIDNLGNQMTYGQLKAFSNEFYTKNKKTSRNIKKCLHFIK